MKKLLLKYRSAIVGIVLLAVGISFHQPILVQSGVSHLVTSSMDNDE